MQQIINEECYQNIFNEPVYTSNHQIVRLKRYFDRYRVPDNENTQPVQLYRQLRDKWFEHNIKNKVNNNFLQKQKSQNDHEQKTSKQYVLIWQLQFPLEECLTISHIKNKVKIPEIDQPYSTIRVYYYWDCLFSHYYSYYSRYDINFNKIQQAFRISNLQKWQYNVYFYLKFLQQDKFQNLTQSINKYLGRKDSFIQYDTNKFKYDIFINMKDFKKNQILSILQKFKEEKVQIYMDIEKNRLYLTFPKIKILQICKPWHVIYLQFEQIQQAKINQQSNQSHFNPIIQIVYYTQQTCQNSLMNFQQKSNQNLKLTKNSLYSKERIIIRRYSQIKNIKINVILNQQNVTDPFMTSLYFQGKILRPSNYFKQIENVVDRKLKMIRLICIPQNLSYYREMKMIECIILKNDLKDLWKELIRNEILNQKYRDIFLQKRYKLMKNQEIPIQYRNQNILDPILLYSMPQISKMLNQYMRQTSVSLYNSKLIQKQLKYQFCARLTNSLLKLKSFQGKVWRASVDCDYCYKQGQIVQWKGFYSTVQKLKTAMTFISSKKSAVLPYLFQIQSYSGKDINQFSCQEDQKEVIFLPYTRFKVIKTTQKYSLDSNFPQFTPQHQIHLTHVVLQQLPIPKKIPGNIVVWIDRNFAQNYRIFNHIVKINNLQDFDLIQIVSNEQFKDWLNEYKKILFLPQVRLHFITNLNRPPNYNKQGIQTLRIIRSFRPESVVVFYVGSIQKTMNAIQQTQYAQDKNIQVIRYAKKLNQIFKTKFAQNF